MSIQEEIQETKPQKRDADYVFYELTRSICPDCRKVIDAKILLRDNKVYMAKRCPECGPFEALVYGDAEMYINFSKYNKPGTIPLAFGTEIKDGCPLDCGLCPDHQQHDCLGIIEVNSACNMNCNGRCSARRPIWPFSGYSQELLCGFSTNRRRGRSVDGLQACRRVRETSAACISALCYALIKPGS